MLTMCVDIQKAHIILFLGCKYNLMKKFEFEFAFEFEFRGWIILSFCRATVYTFWELERISTTTGDDARGRLL